MIIISSNIFEKKMDNYISKYDFPDEIKNAFKYYFSSKRIYLIKVFDEKYVTQYLLNELNNLEQALIKVEKLEDYHSIYVHYNRENRTLYYYLCDKLPHIFMIQADKASIKKNIMDEFYVMLYMELLNINCDNEILSVFNEIEACNIYSLSNEKYKVIIDKEKSSFVYCRHASVRNAEILSYAELIFKLINKKEYYSNRVDEMTIEKIINKQIIIPDNMKTELLFNDDSVYKLIMKYILHIKYRYNYENNSIYHRDLTRILKYNFDKRVADIKKYILNSKKV